MNAETYKPDMISGRKMTNLSIHARIFSPPTSIFRDFAIIGSNELKHRRYCSGAATEQMHDLHLMFDIVRGKWS